MSDIAVSIIVPVYNTSKYLKKCLDSLAAQTLKNIEIIIVDDGSTDNSGIICDSYVDDRRFIILHKDNSGLSGARNYGISHSTGEYIMFVDSDDWIEIDAAEKLYFLAKKYDADYVISGNYNESSNGSTLRNILGKEEKYYFGQEYKDNILVSTLGLTGQKLRNPAKLDNLTPVWARIYRREIIKECGIVFINTKILPSEALQFNFEFLLNAKSACYTPYASYHYRRNAEVSVTKPYKQDIWKRWQWWINNMKEYLANNNVSSDLWDAYYSRICCSVIPLGGNAVKLQSLKLVNEECKHFLSQPIFEEAFAKTSFSVCPIYWRLFFLSAKKQNTIIFILLTKIMRLLLSRRKA